MSLTVQHNQTLLDIAMQCAGLAEAVWDVAVLNNSSISDVLLPGTTLLTPTPLVAYQRTISLLNRPHLWPASGDADAALVPEGIDYWGIDIDFIVQPG